MKHAELLGPTAAKLEEYATYLLGPNGSTRGKTLEKHFVPQLCMAASAEGLSGAPQMIFPVWMANLPAPVRTGPVQVKKPTDAVIAFWNGSDETYLAFEDGRSTSVMPLRASRFVGTPIEFQKGKGFFGTTVPGLVASNGNSHFAIGLRNSIGVGSSYTDHSRPYFAELAERLEGKAPHQR